MIHSNLNGKAKYFPGKKEDLKHQSHTNGYEMSTYLTVKQTRDIRNAGLRIDANVLSKFCSCKVSTIDVLFVTLIFFLTWQITWKYIFYQSGLNSPSPSAGYMRHRTGSALLQVMACRLFGAKPLPEPMQTYCHLDAQEQISIKSESQYKTFHSWKYI